MKKTSKQPFALALMPFGTQHDGLWARIKRAVQEAGADCERVDEQLFTETIMQRLRDQIEHADIIVAEISTPNRNVFYEVGYAHARGKATILLRRKGTRNPFDLKDYPQVIYFDRDPGDLEAPLTARVKQLLQSPGEPFALADFDRFYQDWIRDVRPPDLLFLAVADRLNYPSGHGKRVADMNPEWIHDGTAWDRRSKKLEKVGLLQRTSNEVMRTSLGTAVVYLALRARGFDDVKAAVKSDEAMVKRWGNLDA